MPEQTSPPRVANTHVFTIEPHIADTSNNKQLFLKKDGRFVQCHKQTPIVLPKASVTAGGAPQYEANYVQCSLDCGKANIVEINNIPHFQQTCDPIGLSVRLQNAEEQAAKDAKK